jgi:hypothetical protein
MAGSPAVLELMSSITAQAMALLDVSCDGIGAALFDRSCVLVCVQSLSPPCGLVLTDDLRTLFGVSAARVEMNKWTTSFALQRASMSPFEGHQPAFT